MPSNTLRLNFGYLEIIYILYPYYHPKIIGHTLKNKQKNLYECIHDIKIKMENRSHRSDIIDLSLDMDTSIVNIKSDDAFMY